MVPAATVAAGGDMYLELGRMFADVLERAALQVDHVRLERISPLSVPVLSMIGRERLPTGAAEDDILAEAESLASAAMRLDPE